MNKLSIIIPVYNEKETLMHLLEKLSMVVLPFSFAQEVILIDDGSKDGSADIIKKLDERYIKIINNENKGKGYAIREGLSKSSGDYVVIQDADLEYDPFDISKMLEFMIQNNIEVLYGSRVRNISNEKTSGFIFYLGGILLTAITNLLYNQKITDEPTCYKMFKSNLIKSLPLKCKRFEFCPEVTALVSKRGLRIEEVPISYHPRTISEGKKIKFKDWFHAVWTLLKLRF